MELTENLKNYQSVFMVYDQNVEDLAQDIACKAGIDVCLGIEATEGCKTLDTVQDICRFLMAFGAERDALLLCVGGGTTSDIAGFAAASYKRGIRWAVIPTTLLSMVDASIGGKTGVNVDCYKNMMGAFHLPEFVCPAYEALLTLPEREYRSGAAEMLKTFLLKDEGLYSKAVEAVAAGSRDIRELIDAAAAIKKDIVAADPLEQGERRKLNLGHTFAHAIEWYQHVNCAERPYTHGEAVAIGVVQAARLCNEGLALRLEKDFRRCGLPVELPCSIDDLMPAMEKDKKNLGGEIRFVLINEIGDIII